MLSLGLACSSVRGAGDPSIPLAAPVATPLEVALARGHALVRSSLAAHGPPPDRELSLRCRGVWNELGHYTRPRELRAFDADWSYSFEPARAEVPFSVRFSGTLTREAKSHTGTLQLRPDRLQLVDFGEETARPDDAAERIRTRYRLAELVPSLLLRLALEERASLRWLGEAPLEGGAVDVVSFTDGAGVPRALYIDRTSKLLRRVERIEADELFGDDRRSTDYLAHQQLGGLTLPQRLRHRRLWFVESELTCGEAPAPVLLPALAPPPAEAPAPPRATVEKVADGIYAIALEHLDNTTLFMEAPDHVVAMEAPLDSATGELIIATIAAATNNKPIRYLLLSHHHPDYVGGIRPFVARGTRLVTTPGNADYLNSIAAAGRLLRPDLQAERNRPCAIDLVEGHRQLGEGAHRVDIYDVGKRIGHTEEYLVYYFPAARLLFHGDLVSVKSGAAPPPASDRAVGLLESIEANGLTPERILHSWPRRDRARELPMPLLRRMVELRRAQDAAPTDRR
jgi:glyoxylase-like metal-dependent hydrolase (beta-lactamase superfamily II)